MLASMLFPTPDPIPLPAPVWLFKFLHGTVLTLHFITVQWVLGWIAIGVIWNLGGRLLKNSTMTESSAGMAKSLPILMTYLINFGIPPLLFTQLLYGNFLYTSSVLIGVWWISVVALVIFAYSALYAGSERAANARGWWVYGLIALGIGILIARIYSTNMTLMLRPGVWTEMFRSNPHGTALPPTDPTAVPRWLLMLAGSLTIGGLCLVAAGVWRKNTAAVKGFMVRNGGWIATAGALLQAAAAFRVYATQPGAVLAKLAESPLYRILPLAWIALAALAGVLGLLALVRREKAGNLLASGAAVITLLLTAVQVVYRDGIRDLTLLTAGYNVWDQNVVANWPIVLLFLGVFVIGLVLLGWMIAIACKAKPHTEEVAQ